MHYINKIFSAFYKKKEFTIDKFETTYENRFTTSKISPYYNNEKVPISYIIDTKGNKYEILSHSVNNEVSRLIQENKGKKCTISYFLSTKYSLWIENDRVNFE